MPLKFGKHHSQKATLAPYRGIWDEKAVAHLLRRTMFSATLSDIAFFQKLNAKKAAHQLVYGALPELIPPINSYNDDKVTDEEVPLGKTWIFTKNKDGKLNGHRMRSFKAWWIGQMIASPRSINEKMILFWANHFSIETRSVGNPLFVYYFHDVLRRHALGNFRVMVKEVTLSPAMLKYLNGNANVKTAPDENYGRELQELFTIGKGPGSHYTEDDVKAAAHVLTGYKLEKDTIGHKFNPKQHDEGDKHFSAFYGNRVIRGRSGKDGEDELDDLLDMIFGQDEVANFICRKLYIYFVHHEIDMDIEERIIAPLAAIFRKNRYDIQPVLETLLASEHFYDVKFRGALIKSPIELTVGLCREFNVQFPTMDDYKYRYLAWDALQGQTAYMQQNLGDPPNVAGWQAYYEAPGFSRLWVNSDTLPKRKQYTDRMINKGFEKDGKRLAINPLQFAQQFKNPQDPDSLINEACNLLLAVDIADEHKLRMKSSILLAGQQAGMGDHYWTMACENLRRNPNDEEAKKQVTNKVKTLFQYMMNLPEYQLC